MLIGQNGEQQTVLRIKQEFVSGFLVHNLTIREDHTFAVGPDAILVHNTGGCGGLPDINPSDFVGKKANIPEHLPAGTYPALVVDGKVYAGRMHSTAWELSGKKGTEQFYGLVEIDDAGNVKRLFN